MMGTKSLRAIMGLIIALGLCAPAMAQELDVSAASRKALGITTTPVIADASVEGASAFGTVVAPPGHSHPVTSPFDAVLLEPLVIPGIRVEAGAPLARLYSPEYEMVRADLESQRLTSEHMAILADRDEELRSLGLRSKAEADEAEHEAMSAALIYAANKSKLGAIRPASGSGRFELLATASGIVTELAVEAGAPVGVSEPLFSIFDGEGFWLDVALPERVANSVSLGSTVTLPGRSETGTVVAIDPRVDPQFQSVRIKISLPGGLSWRLGQLVDLSLETPSQEMALVVPARALVRINGADFIFVETENGFKLVQVVVLVRSREQIVLTGDVRAGEQVAISGLAALKNLAEGV
jgi:membrane fusion protein, heavy metal efflux system